MPSPEFLGGSTPNRSDAIWAIEQKILGAIKDGGGSGGSGGLAGTGSPEGVVTASPGATYYDTSSGAFYAKETGTGNTGWVALIV